jgi:hypothetical protein
VRANCDWSVRGSSIAASVAIVDQIAAKLAER